MLQNSAVQLRLTKRRLVLFFQPRPRSQNIVIPVNQQRPLTFSLKDLEIGAVPHGFRSSFRDWAAEETDHPREVIEAALAHVVGNKVEAAYARSDLFERRRLMNDWSAYLAGEGR